jgi:hypothetical protein
VATEQKERELVGSQAGLASAIAVETHGELGEIEAVRARGYWEQVWRRFRRDKVALASGGFIIFLVFIATAGGPIAAHFLGHGPNDLNLSAGLHGVNQLPVGPWSHVPCSGFAVPPSGCRAMLKGLSSTSSAPTGSSATMSSCACSTARGSRSRSPSCRRSGSC